MRSTQTQDSDLGKCATTPQSCMKCISGYSAQASRRHYCINSDVRNKDDVDLECWKLNGTALGCRFRRNLDLRRMPPEETWEVSDLPGSPAYADTGTL